jgi:hypothetical protein
MDQFEVHMRFLQIKQVSAFKYVLKIYFSINFSDFLILWTGPRFLESAGVSGVNFTKIQAITRLDRGLFSLFAEVSFTKAPADPVRSNLNRTT